MSAGGIETVRVPVAWSSVEAAAPVDPPSPLDPPAHTYDWSRLDQTVEAVVGHDLDVLPFLYRTPGWLGTTPTALPSESDRERSAWEDFVEAAVRRYGPEGEFWIEHSPQSSDPLPSKPIRRWQIWNEENFFHFTSPVSPAAYATLLKISARAIRGVDPGGRVLLGGLYGRPRESLPRALPAAGFLKRLYAISGIRSFFDDVALHPYAADARRMANLTEGLRRVVVNHHDDAGLFITEMGWGSQNDPLVVSFERGLRGQAHQLRRAYDFLIGNRRRLKLRRVYWFAWKDAGPDSCAFCDSAGLFRTGAGFDAKPAWKALTRITGGRVFPF